jgi:hypothetical protein
MLTSLGPNIHITGLKQPDDGCAVAIKCPHCNRIEIAWSPYAKKPEDGGTMWVILLPCFEHTTVLWFFDRSKFTDMAGSMKFSGWSRLPEVSNG